MPHSLSKIPIQNRYAQSQEESVGLKTCLRELANISNKYKVIDFKEYSIYFIDLMY